MIKRYIDKVCVITGGTRGIGLATAKRFLEEQAGAVIICSSTEKSVESAMKELDKTVGKERVVGVKCDVADKS
jgi:NAD(P)-dependent dehydrogenase (short-subunit alcohol dehydrogenase family)